MTMTTSTKEKLDQIGDAWQEERRAVVEPINRPKHRHWNHSVPTMIVYLLLLLLRASSAQSNACDLTLDTICPWPLDGVCDADGLVCPLRNSDCLDCDPCAVHRSCSTCVDATCSWCDERCVSSQHVTHEIVAKLQWCNDTWKTVISECGGSNAAQIASSLPPQSTSGSSLVEANNLPDPSISAGVGSYTCYSDNADASCQYRYDGICDVEEGFCSEDCFDCDPCRAYRFEGCQACTAANCLWCGADALCVSPESLVPGVLEGAGSKLTCSNTDFTAFCPINFGMDPIEEAMGWVYDAINVRPAWEKGYSGKGIGIRINDDGLDVSHPEIGEDRFSGRDSCPLHEPIGTHGTTIASIAAGSANNGVCGKGIAFEATLSACRVIDTESGDWELAREKEDYVFLSKYISRVDIMINSFGDSGCVRDDRRRLRHLQSTLSTSCPFSVGVKSPCPYCRGVDWNNIASRLCSDAVEEFCSSDQVLLRDQDIAICHDYLHLFARCAYTRLNERDLASIVKGISEGRGGKGIIYFWASGNDHDFGSDVGTEGILVSRYIIPVAATGKDDRRTSFSTGGAALLVTGPGGDFDHYTNNLGAFAGGSCHDIGPGTSFSAPVVAGAAALMLEANPDLSWRDVQGIFAKTSQKVHPDDSTWVTNGAGLHHSSDFGFGVVDATAAVDAAETWKLYTDEWMIALHSGTINKAIPDQGAGTVRSTISVVNEVNPTFSLESVEVSVGIIHASRGDLDIILTSPHGTKSVLHPGRRPESSWNLEWKFLTVRCWGESAVGDWTLELIDRVAGDVFDCADLPWELKTRNGVSYGCHDLVYDDDICEDGGVGPDFEDTLGALASSLNDPVLADGSGLTPGEACCACGGGVSPGQVQDQLEFWTLTIYGHDFESPQPPSNEVEPSSAGHYIQPLSILATLCTFCIMY